MNAPMSKKAFRNVIGSRAAIASVLLVTNALVWYFYAFTIMGSILNSTPSDQFTTLLLWSVHFAGAIFSVLIGALWMKAGKSRTSFLISWMLLGAVSSLAYFVGNTVGTLGLAVLFFLFGVSFGAGMPICMGYFSDYTPVENRGSLGGIIVFAFGLGMFLLRILPGSIATEALILAGWRMAGLVAFLLIKPYEESGEAKNVSYRSLLSQRSLIFYLVPWILFSLVNNLSQPVLSNILKPSLVEFSITIENVLAGVFAIVGGFLTDFLGRKRMATAGFVMLGLGYTILGIAPQSTLSVYFYTVVDGVAWGTLFVIFVMAVWGDLSYGAFSDKYYAIGGVPFLVSIFLPTVIGQYISTVSPYAIFSFTAFFLFLAVLPLMYAPETLPEKTIKDRELQGYVVRAKRAKEKYS